MKNLTTKIASLSLAVVLGMNITSCDSLELAPIDNYGSGNYWSKPAHITAYMDGIHAQFREQAYQHFYNFGEARGGTFKVGICIDGSSSGDDYLKTQSVSETNTISNFGNIYGRIVELNEFLGRTLEATYMSDADKAYYLGQAYGLRAFYYFDLYRIYGGVPLRTTPDVINGIIDPSLLEMERATPAQVMKLIKDDIKKSLDYFGDSKTIKGNKSYWSKAATECLAGEVYLWTAKVTTGDDTANEADLTTAKTHLLNVANNYDFALQPNFNQVFDVNNKGNGEVIMAVRYMDGEASNRLSWYVYSLSNGNLKSFYGEDGKKYVADTLQISSGGIQYHEYKNELYLSFNKKDSRRDATFLGAYRKADDGKLTLAGTYLSKNLGFFKKESNSRVFCGDFNIYRLPWVYLALAEIENMQGGDVAKYINLVRQRAYGTNWNEEQYAYKNGDFTANELAILHEKDKEFVTEGQRWFDVRRMTLTKGGDHLVFCKEANYDSDAPLLVLSNDPAKDESHKVLLPLNTSLLNNDSKLEQTPGYTR